MGMRIIAIFAIFASALLGVSGHAFAQNSDSACTQYESMVDYLGRQFGEYLISSGASQSGAQIEVFSRPDGSTWSVVLVGSQDGVRIGCMVDAGENWRVISALPGEDS